MKTTGASALLAILLSSLPCGDAARAQELGWPRSIEVATASPGGVFYVYGEGLARVLSGALGIEVTAQATQGAAQNVILLEKRQAMLGIITMGVGLQGWNGAGWAKGTQYRSMRVIFPMYDTVLHFAATKRPGIRSLSDLTGLRIGAGPRAGTGGTYVPEIFDAIGITASLRYGSWEDMQSQLTSGELDGAVFVGGVPLSALAELDAKHPVEFIQPSSEELAIIRKKIPEITPSIVPAGSYRSLAKDYHTIGLFTFAVGHKDLPDDLVYRIVKAVFENRDELIKAHSAAKETVPANIDRNTFLPLHPGAARYYREIGITIPELLPTN